MYTLHLFQFTSHPSVLCICFIRRNRLAYNVVNVPLKNITKNSLKKDIKYHEIKKTKVQDNDVGMNTLFKTGVYFTCFKAF